MNDTTDAPSRIQYVAAGNDRCFPFPFLVLKPADLQVFLNDTVCTTGFVVTGTGSTDGGEVRFDTAPAAQTVVTLRHHMVIARTADFHPGGAFRARAINEELDCLTIAVQQARYEASRAVAPSPTASLDRAPALPKPAPGKAIGWSDDGTALVNDPADFSDAAAKMRRWAATADSSVSRAEEASQQAEQASTQAAAAANDAASWRDQAQTLTQAADTARTAAARAREGAESARIQAEAHATDTAFATLAVHSERRAAVRAARLAQADAAVARDRADEALSRLDHTDLTLWRAEHAAHEAKHAATQATTLLPLMGTGPHQFIPNWARILS